MPALALLSAVFVVGVEQTLQWKYGASGIIGMLLLTIGLKAKNPAISSTGAVVLALLVAGPALLVNIASVSHCGRRQLVSASSELIVSHSALNHRWDCSTKVVSRSPTPCSNGNSIDCVPSESYSSRCSWSICCLRRFSV